MASQTENEMEQPIESPSSTSSNQNAWKRIWQDNKGMFLILLSEIAGSSMDAIVRTLQQSNHGFHAFQLIFARMGMTFILSSFYMWWTSVPDFPLGKANVRGWLILRAVFGLAGLFCLYYGVHYLPLAENTVIRFLVPLTTAISCSIFLHQKFTTQELIAGLIALAGVIIIAHPATIFDPIDDFLHATGAIDDVTPTQRLIAITVAILGVVFASAAYTTIRLIGNNAHALISVNYFSILATLVSSIALLTIPDENIRFIMPRDRCEWFLLILLGILGFILQFLLTKGLQLDRSSKATSVMYMQVIFALAFDWAVWGVVPGGWSVFGGVIVIGSTFWVAVMKNREERRKDGGKVAVVDEETALLAGESED